INKSLHSTNHPIPKSGYIDVSNFASPKHLADYLIYLDKNSTAYNSYFEWKQYPSRFSVFCDMCIKLHMERFTGIEKKVFDDIHGYWHSNMCKTVKLDSETLHRSI
ncbi:Glyco 3-alpha-L-fucosyltransferase A, partial [Brachionus plicatilis]